MDIAVDDSGEMSIAGYTVGSIDFGGGALPPPTELVQDIFVARFDAAGTHRWSDIFHSPGLDNPFSASGAADGSVVLAGSFTNTIDFGGGNLVSAGNGDIFVAKFGP